MERISADEFKKRYGEAGLKSFASTSTSPLIPKPQEKGVFGRVTDVIKGQGERVAQAVQGQGEFAGQSPLQRGVEATAEAFNAVPQTALAVAPAPVRNVVESVGNVVGEQFSKLTNLIGSNPDLQKWVQENPEATETIMNIAKTATAGGEIAGTVLGAQGTANTLQTGVNAGKAVVQNVAKTADDAFGDFSTLRPTTQQIATERGAKIRSGFEEQNTRLKSADAAYNKNTIVRKLPDGTEKTITPIDTFADNDIAPVIEKGSIQMGDYKLGEGPLGIIKEKVQSIDNEIDTKLINSGERIKLNDLQERALNAVRNNTDFKQEGSVATNLAKVQSRFDDYRMSYGDDIDVAELNNIRKVANRDWKPETQDTSRVIGDVARNYVYDAVPDEVIKDLLQKQGELLAAKKYAEKINGTKVTGGRLGNYAMRTAGAVLGSTVEKAPVIGPVAGMLGGEAIARLMQQSQFKSAWTELRSLIAKDTPSQTVSTPTK